MTWLLVAFATALVVAGILGTVVPGLPGPVFVLVGLIFLSWLDGFSRISGGTIAVLTILAAGCYVVEFTATAVGASYSGASRWAVSGAISGTFLGLFFGLPGLLLGPFLGAVAGEYMAGEALAQATRAGWGAWLGFVVGTALKLCIVLSMVAISATAFFK